MQSPKMEHMRGETTGGKKVRYIGKKLAGNAFGKVF